MIVCVGDFHASTLPAWVPSGERRIIPLGISELFLAALPGESPPRRAIFTSNPLRSLDWLLDVWCERIHPAAPDAELHIFSGPQTYGALGAAKTRSMLPVLERARSLAHAGVVMRGTVPKAILVEELRQTRVYLYRGDPGETFCLSAAEAQALGVPGVVEDIACMRERISDEQTGFVVRGVEAFAAAAIRLLTDDALWQAQHRQALATQRRLRWAEAAMAFERLIPGFHATGELITDGYRSSMRG